MASTHDWCNINRTWFTTALADSDPFGDVDLVRGTLASLADFGLLVLTTDTVEVAHGIIAVGTQTRPDLAERCAQTTAELVSVEHPDTLTARANLAASYRQVGRTNEAGPS